MGLAKNKIIQPRKKEVKAKIKNIFKFEYPKTFIVNRSLLFLIFISSWFTGNKNRSFRYFCVYLSINLFGRALDRKETKLKLEIVSEE